ncbi:MAG: peptidase domain-containing ABC transporter [Proteobacteria bacterium]|nr:peptidase domain-containing ABC transporter [Pseudomonadota bacterium]
MTKTTASSGPASSDPPESLSALRKLLRRRGRRHVPYVQGLTRADCGAACLTMVLRYHGREAKLDEVRAAMGIGRDGADALSILREAESYGLRGRGIRLEVTDLRHLSPATILHWEFNHFVVFERLSQNGVAIVDPAIGRRFLPMSDFSRAFTGVALQLEPSDTFEATRGHKSNVWSYLRQLLVQRHLIARIVVTSVLLRLFALALPVLTGLIVDQVVPRADRHLLLVVGLGLAVVLGFQFLSELIRTHLLLQLRTNLDIRMTVGFLDHLVGLPYGFFQRRSTGDLMMRVNSNTTVRELITSHTLSTLLDGSLVLLYLLFMLLLSPPLGLVVLALGVLQIAVFLLSRRRIRELMTRDLEVQARSRGYLVELLSGIESLKVAGAEYRAVEHWSNLYIDELNVSLERGRLRGLIDALMSWLRTGSPLLILSYGAILVLDGQLTLGTMLALNALAAGFLAPLATLVESALQLQMLGSYIERIDDVLDTDLEQDRTKVARASALRGRIALDNVSFRYTPHSPMVVKNVTLTVSPGSNVAIVGKSGVGKSTLANLLIGLYQPTEGRILHDGHDLANLDVRTVRRQCGIVPQHPYLFGSSIRENIALTQPTAPFGNIVAAAKAACIDDDIRAMPMGYDTIISDGGASLSGGQRQRLALARALVHRPAVLLLDEATSSLDTATEKAIAHNLESMRCTRIVIAHRLSTIMGADIILVMDDGAVVETGNHDQLLALGGVYAELIAAQAIGDRPHPGDSQGERDRGDSGQQREGEP